MKLMICPKCEDRVALTSKLKSCYCGKVSGRYLFDERTVVVSPRAKLKSIPNSKLLPTISFFVRDKDPSRDDVDFIDAMITWWNKAGDGEFASLLTEWKNYFKYGDTRGYNGKG